jgi:hypothetical protein
MNGGSGVSHAESDVDVCRYCGVAIEEDDDHPKRYRRELEKAARNSRMAIEYERLPWWDPDTSVGTWHRPWTDGVMCAAETGKQTVLTEEQATVAAVQALGYDIHEMASAHGGFEDDVREILEEPSGEGAQAGAIAVAVCTTRTWRVISRITI